MATLSSEDQEGQDENLQWYWSATDKAPPVELNSTRTTALFHPEHSVGCAGVRGTTTFGNKMEHYFEVEILAPLFGQARMVGIGTGFCRLSSAYCDFSPLLGRDEYSYGINYTGDIHHKGQSRQYIEDIDAEKATKITVGVHFDTLCHCLSFSVNGRCDGVAYSDLDDSAEYYPIICSSSQRSVIKLTACRSSVASLLNTCRHVIRKKIRNSLLVDHLPLPSQLVEYLKFQSPCIQPVKPIPPSGKETVV